MAAQTRPEPVLLLDLVKAVIALGVGLGWWQLGDTAISTILTIVGGVATLVLSFITRSKVTPVSDPQVPDTTASGV
ncbi:hypothetical protein ACL02T_32865 [Pseudonocardia sp. RS010]|uniref:hypothetical protein n=1 Tax=Pseudonocardia sp. RS010 TaxID=3385979 RepID=UPI0039A2DCC5